MWPFGGLHDEGEETALSHGHKSMKTGCCLGERFCPPLPPDPRSGQGQCGSAVRGLGARTRQPWSEPSCAFCPHSHLSSGRVPPAPHLTISGAAASNTTCEVASRTRVLTDQANKPLFCADMHASNKSDRNTDRFTF